MNPKALVIFWDLLLNEEFNVDLGGLVAEKTYTNCFNHKFNSNSNSDYFWSYYFHGFVTN